MSSGASSNNKRYQWYDDQGSTLYPVTVMLGAAKPRYLPDEYVPEMFIPGLFCASPYDARGTPGKWPLRQAADVDQRFWGPKAHDVQEMRHGIVFSLPADCPSAACDATGKGPIADHVKTGSSELKSQDSDSETAAKCKGNCEHVSETMAALAQIQSQLEAMTTAFHSHAGLN